MPVAGALLSSSEGGAPLYLDASEVEAAVRANTSVVPVGFFVGMIERESGGKWNEVDTDYDEAGEPRTGLDTYGLCQVRKSEFLRALSLGAVSDEAACDPATNLQAFSNLMGTNLAAIRAASPDALDFDVWCYLAWSHNAGLGSALKSIATYGLDWEAAKARPQNAWFTTRLIPYAEHIANRVGDFTSYDPQTGGTVSEVGNGTNTMLLRLGLLALIGWGLWRYWVNV